MHRVVIGEIGVFGFESLHAVTDVGALVSPEVLPWKNAGHSFVRIVRSAGASAFVISERALERNEYPTVGVVWANSEERAWLDEVFDDIGFVDAFRSVNSDAEQYTWWSNRGQAWAKNVGWRLDYQIVTPGLADTVRTASIYKRKRFSDHAPLVMDYDMPLP